MTVANRILLSPPAIAALLCRDRVTAWRHVVAGNFGPTFRRGRIVYVDLAGVENFAGMTFTDKLIEDACQGKTDPCIIIEETEAA
jgi:hypothetical protein